MKKFLQVSALIIICESVGLLGSLVTFPAISGWYSGLDKPFFSPPNWIFGPVWILLYALMGISLFLVIQKGFKTKKVRDATYVFAVQLFLNAIWSPIFFGVKNLLLALIVIVVMWFYILKTIIAFGKIDKTASRLLYPYLAWVTFATILNFSVLLLNR